MIQKLMRKLWEAESVIAVSFALLEPIARIFAPPHKFIGPYVKDGQVVADLGCARGYYTLALADSVGPEGKVYAVDVNKKMIRTLEKKVEKGNYRNIESHASSAADLSFIEDRSVDFVFANGLLCSMPYDRQLSVSEIKRVLKTTGQAFLSLGAGPPFGFMDQAEWEQMLKGFRVEKGGSFKKGWAVVSVTQD